MLIVNTEEGSVTTQTRKLSLMVALHRGPPAPGP